MPPPLRWPPSGGVFSPDSSAPVPGAGPGHPLPRWHVRVTSATADKGKMYHFWKTTWNIPGNIHALHASPGKSGWGAGQSEPMERHLGATHPCFPAPAWGPERESVLAAVTQQGGAGPWVQTWRSLFSKSGKWSALCSFPPPCPHLPLLHFRRREGGREAAPECRVCPREGGHPPPAALLHGRIKDRWITANEPARAINTREPSQDESRAQPAGAGLSLAVAPGRLAARPCALIVPVIGSLMPAFPGRAGRRELPTAPPPRRSHPPHPCPAWPRGPLPPLRHHRRGEWPPCTRALS